LQHLISDAATMQIIRWTDGGFGMACHNYDGDMLTDEVAQVHRSPGFITSNLVGKREDGALIKEYEASHGTVADLWHAHLRGEETSMNPLGMVVALLGAMEHAATLQPDCKDAVFAYTEACRLAVYQAFRDGRGTRDMAGPKGLTTESFVATIADDLQVWSTSGSLPQPKIEEEKETVAPPRKFRRNYDVDEERIKALFAKYDTNGDGSISLDEFVDMTMELGIAPLSPQAVSSEEEREKNKTDREAPKGKLRNWSSIDLPRFDLS